MAAPQCIAFASFLALVFTGVKYRPPPQSNALPPVEADILVIGGGSGGSVVAGRMSEISTLQVVLLEYGPEEPVVQQVPAFSGQTYFTTEYDWQLKVEATKNDNTGVIARAKMLGGCSSHNGGVYQRGTHGDYQCWVEAGAKGWSYQDVLPFYKKSENALDADLARDKVNHGTGGPLSVQRMPYQDVNTKLLRGAYKEAGLPEVDLNGGKVEGFQWSQTTTKQGQRASANTAFLSEARKRRTNLHVITKALVKKIHINASTKRAEAVEYTDSTGATKIIKVKLEVVLSAGTYFSPQLLMASGVGPADQLKKAGIPVIVNLPTVGTNLQDHILSSNMPTISLSRTAVVPTVAQLQNDAKSYAKGQGPLTINGLNSLVVRLRSPLQANSDLRPYMQVQHQSQWAAKNLVPYCQQAKPAANSTSCYYNKVSVNTVLLHSQEAGSVQLNASNPFGPPLIYQKIFSTDQDVRVHAAGLKRVTDMLVASKALRNAGAVVSLPAGGAACGGKAVGSQAWYECVVLSGGGQSWGHGVGTCSIGKVVDPRLRVLGGVKGLRVADASVMPCVPSGNTNAPSIMVGERAAEFIKQDHGLTR